MSDHTPGPRWRPHTDRNGVLFFKPREEEPMYAIQATIEGRQVPTFYLHPAVQGIVSKDHAAAIARDILGFRPCGWTCCCDACNTAKGPLSERGNNPLSLSVEEV